MSNTIEYEKFIDMKSEQLEELVKQCNIDMETTRAEIVKNYELAQPYIHQMRLLKIKLKKLAEKKDAAKTFLSMENNGSLVSSINLSEFKNELPIEPETPRKPPPKNTPTTPRNIPIPTTPRKEASLNSLQYKPPTKFKSQVVMNWVNKNKK